MSIKLALLKSGETIISDIKELISDDKVCGFLLKNPHIINVIDNRSALLIEEGIDEYKNSFQISLSPWIFLSKDNEIPISPDWIVAIVEPLDSVNQMYEEKVNGTNNQVSFTEE